MAVAKGKAHTKDTDPDAIGPWKVDLAEKALLSLDVNESKICLLAEKPSDDTLEAYFQEVIRKLNKAKC